MNFFVAGKPYGKSRPRTTVVGGYARIYTEPKALKYEEYVRDCCKIENGNFEPIPGYISMTIEAVFPIPKQTTKKDRQAMLDGSLKPDKKPDLDNIAKTICDALNGFAYDDDKQIIELIIRKKYGSEPGVYVGLNPIE